MRCLPRGVRLPDLTYSFHFNASIFLIQILSPNIAFCQRLLRGRIQFSALHRLPQALMNMYSTCRCGSGGISKKLPLAFKCEVCLSLS